MRLNSLTFDAISVGLTDGSIDLNLQAAGIGSGGMRDLLTTARARRVKAGRRFPARYVQIKHHTPGRLSGNVHREESHPLMPHCPVERL